MQNGENYFLLTNSNSGKFLKLNFAYNVAIMLQPTGKAAKLWVRKLMQLEDYLKYTEEESDLITAVSKEVGSKSCLCEKVVLK